MANNKVIEINKMQLMNLVNNLLRQVQKCCNQTQSPKLSDFEKWMAPNFQLFSNGKIISKNAADYMKRLVNFQKKFVHMEISDMLEEPLIYENKMAVHYDIDLTGRNGNQSKVFVMAIITLENDKVLRWEQVAHEKGTGIWDS